MCLLHTEQPEWPLLLPPGNQMAPLSPVINTAMCPELVATEPPTMKDFSEQWGLNKKVYSWVEGAAAWGPHWLPTLLFVICKSGQPYTFPQTQRYFHVLKKKFCSVANQQAAKYCRAWKVSRMDLKTWLTIKAGSLGGSPRMSPSLGVQFQGLAEEKTDSLGRQI